MTPPVIQHPLRATGLRIAKDCLIAQVTLFFLVLVLVENDNKGFGLIYWLEAFFNCFMWVGLFLPWLYDLVRGRNAFNDQLLFVRQLGDLLAIGMSIPEALEGLASDERQGWRTRFCQVSKAAEAMAAATARGDRLGESMARTGVFPEHWSRLLEAAEAHGAVIEVLQELEIGRSARSWFTIWFMVRLFYLWVLAIPVVLFLVTYIFPTFIALFEGMAVSLPTVTLVFLAVVKTVRELSILGLPLTLLVLWLLWSGFRSGTDPSIARKFRVLFSSLPFIRNVMWLEEQAVVASTLATCERLGLSSVEGLSVAQAAVTLPVYQKALSETGESLATTMNRNPQLFAPPLRWLTAQGESYGNLTEAMTAAARYLTEEADASKERLALLLDTAATFILGGFAGFTAVAIYLPLIQLIGAMMEKAVMP